MKKSEALNILGLSDGATDDEVKKAHRDKVRVNHPDRFTDPVQKQEAEDKTKLINEARDVLLSRKWDPEYGPRTGGWGNPYNNPYTTYRPADSSWTGSSGYGWPPTGSGQGSGGQRPEGNVEWGGIPFTYVWTSWGGETGEGAGAGFDPFEVIFGQAPKKTAAELADEAKRLFTLDMKVLAGKIGTLIICALTGNLAVGMFTYAVITLFYGFYRNNRGCSSLLIVPFLFFFGPLIALLAPRAGVQLTGGSLLFCGLAIFYDIATIRRDFASYQERKKQAEAA